MKYEEAYTQQWIIKDCLVAAGQQYVWIDNWN